MVGYQSKAAGLEELDEELELGWVFHAGLTQPGFCSSICFGVEAFFEKGDFFLRHAIKKHDEEKIDASVMDFWLL